MSKIRQSYRFQCTGCGHCCTGTPETHYIEVRPDEKEAIRVHLGISHQWFHRRYMVNVAEGVEGVRIDPNGNCAFLDKNRRCRVYPVRPVQCQSYPFWPEILVSTKAWNKEKKHCEGINRGKPVPKRRIRQWLQLLEEVD